MGTPGQIHEKAFAAGRKHGRRVAATALIEVIGAPGPETLEETVARAVTALREADRLRAALRSIAKEALRDVAENSPPNKRDSFMALRDTANGVLKHIRAAGIDPEALAGEEGA